MSEFNMLDNQKAYCESADDALKVVFDSKNRQLNGSSSFQLQLDKTMPIELGSIPSSNSKDTLPTLHIDSVNREILKDYYSTRIRELSEHPSADPGDFSTSTRLDFANQIASATLGKFTEIDLNEDQMLSLDELRRESLSKIDGRSLVGSEYLIANRNRIAALHNDEQSLFESPTKEFNKHAISAKDLSTLKAITGTDEDLRNYANTLNWQGLGGPLVELGGTFAALSLMVTFEFRKEGLIGMGAGLAVAALGWAGTLYCVRSRLESQRKEISMDSSMDAMLKTLNREF